jgi:hypothetical protein
MKKTINIKKSVLRSALIEGEKSDKTNYSLGSFIKELNKNNHHITNAKFPKCDTKQ